MSDIAIKVENLSKRYRIGLEEEQHDTFVSAALAVLNRPLRNLRRLRRLTRFSGDDPGPQSSVSSPLSPPHSFVSGLPSDIIWALKDISFEVPRGEVLGIIGRNGAGKTTLLKILSRITHPTTGRVEIRGRVSSLLEVGTGFHPELTGRENIYLNGTILGMRKAEIDRKFDEIVDFSGVEKFIDTPVKRYSSGMRVRLAFSVAAHLEPEILLIDEVLAVGDVGFQKRCLGKMGEVAKEGRTILFVSHNLQAVDTLCSRGIIIQEGRMTYEGPVGIACEKYLREFSKSKELIFRSESSQQSNNEVKIVDLEVIDPETSLVTDHLRSGQSFIVRIYFETEKQIRNPKFGFALLTALGTRVFNTVSTDCGLEIEHLHNASAIELFIESITLAPGDYTANVAITDRIGNYYDYIQGIPCFIIDPSNVLPRTRPYDTQSGVIYAKVLWREPIRFSS